MAVDGKHGVGRAAEVLDVYQEMGCDIIGLQETRRSGQSALLQPGHSMLFTAAVSPEATGKGRRAKVEFDWLFARVSPVREHDRRSSSATSYLRWRSNCAVELEL